MIIETLTAWALNYGMVTAGTTVAVFIGGWILKKIPTGKFSKWAREKGEAQGKAVTKYFNDKIPALWNGIIEPILIDTLNAVGIGWLSGFVIGLKFDNDNPDKSISS